MATKSIFKNVNISNRPLSRRFVDALENAGNKYSKPVEISRTCVDIKGDKIRELFGDKK